MVLRKDYRSPGKKSPKHWHNEQWCAKCFYPQLMAELVAKAQGVRAWVCNFSLYVGAHALFCSSRISLQNPTPYIDTTQIARRFSAAPFTDRQKWGDYATTWTVSLSTLPNIHRFAASRLFVNGSGSVLVLEILSENLVYTQHIQDF